MQQQGLAALQQFTLRDRNAFGGAAVVTPALCNRSGVSAVSADEAVDRILETALAKRRRLQAELVAIEASATTIIDTVEKQRLVAEIARFDEVIAYYEGRQEAA